jgi:signal transduction histidine kinase
MTERPSRSATNRIRGALTNVYLVDGAIAVGLATLSLVAFFGGAPDVGPPGALTVLLLLLESLPLVARRRYPLAVVLVILAATTVHIAIVPEGGELRAGLGPLVALYTAGERIERRLSIGILVAMMAIVALQLLAREGLPNVLQSLIQTELIFGAAWLLGIASRMRGIYTRTLEEQTRLLAREREERALRAVMEERERIARELHDAVTHHVSVIVIQAGGALRSLERRPDEARSALEAIDTTARQALTDMRRMLGILGEADDAGESAEPMPGLDRLGDLIEQVRSAGLSVELSVHGERRSLDPGLELSAYRIIQEGLTNSLKHAGGGRARVTIRYGTDALELSIDDERGAAPSEPMEPAHDGRGLVGMRERVAMFRGTFAARPTATGFRVTAVLPLAETEAP